MSIFLRKKSFQFFMSLKEINKERKLWNHTHETKNVVAHNEASISENHSFLNLVTKQCLMAALARSNFIVWATFQVRATPRSYTTSSSSSSELSSESQSWIVELFSRQLLQSCSLRVMLHFKPLARHWQFGSLQTEEHLQDKNSVMTARAGDPVIQQIISFPSSWHHPWPLGLEIRGHSSRARRHTPAW